MKRSGQMWHDQKRRAAKRGETVPYTTEELRDKIRQAMGQDRVILDWHPTKAEQGLCKYCDNKLAAKTFSGDHSQPLSRGGTWDLSNIDIICLQCNEAKGPMTEDEFTSLCQLAKSWPSDIRTNLFARLKAGSRIAQFTKRKEVANDPESQSESERGRESRELRELQTGLEDEHQTLDQP